jgi:membrane protein DedA with SNARE-associated domain
VTSFVGDHGLLAVFILMFVAAVLPAASELTMLYGGALASGALAGHIAHFHSGFHAYLAVVVVGAAANTLGAILGWAIGYYGGHPLLERHGKLLHATPERIERAERWFDRFGPVAVPLGFATPLVRSFVALPAGILEWPLRRLVPLAALGCLAFCAAVAGIGWAVGSSWD